MLPIGQYLYGLESVKLFSLCHPPAHHKAILDSTGPRKKTSSSLLEVKHAAMSKQRLSDAKACYYSQPIDHEKKNIYIYNKTIQIRKISWSTQFILICTAALSAHFGKGFRMAPVRDTETSQPEAQLPWLSLSPWPVLDPIRCWLIKP